MARKLTTKTLQAALAAQGYDLPRECAEVRLLMPAHGALKLQFDCWVTDEDLVKIGAALRDMGQVSIDEDLKAME